MFTQINEILRVQFYVSRKERRRLYPIICVRTKLKLNRWETR